MGTKFWIHCVTIAVLFLLVLADKGKLVDLVIDWDYVNYEPKAASLFGTY